jgi:hypothetical protein
MASDIKIRTLIGPGIKTYIQSIAKVRQMVLSEIPYLQLGGPETDLKYLKHISLSKDSIAVLVFDGSKIIGVSTGAPLSEELPGFQEPFIKRGLPVDDYYYFGFSALLKPYRSRGIAHHFFNLREEHVRHLKRFNKICFTSLIPPKGLVRPTEQTNLETFWQKRGYVEHPEMKCLYPILDSHFSIALKFWIKDFSSQTISSQKNSDQISSFAYE